MADVAERNMKGQFKYADRVNARFTAVIGEEEIAENRLTLKNMKTSEQKQISAEELIKELKVSE